MFVCFLLLLCARHCVRGDVSVNLRLHSCACAQLWAWGMSGPGHAVHLWMPLWPPRVQSVIAHPSLPVCGQPSSTLISFLQALSIAIQPRNAPSSLKLLGQLVDDVWAIAGEDKSTDYNYYTKRGLLAGYAIAVMLEPTPFHNCMHMCTRMLVHGFNMFVQ